jgi:hypothetical protein
MNPSGEKAGRVVAVPLTGTLGLRGELARVAIKSRMWLTWARLATRSEAQSHEARSRMIERKQKAVGEAAELLVEEFEPALISVVSAAFAIDALYGAIRGMCAVPPDLAQSWSGNRVPRHAQILETLKLGFSVGRKAQRWTTNFEWLFGARDNAAHPIEEFKEPSLHPVLGGVAPVYIAYSPETATRAVDLMLDVFSACVGSPKLRLTELWAEGETHFVDRLLKQREAARQ